MANTDLNKRLRPSEEDNQNSEWSDFGDIAGKYQKLYSQEKKYYELREQLSKKYHIQELEDALKNQELSANDRLRLETQLREKIQLAEQNAINGTIRYREQMYKKGSANMKAQMLKDEADAVKEKLKNIDLVYAQEYATATRGQRAALTKKHRAETIAYLNEESKIRKEQYELENSQQAKSVQRLIRNAKEVKGNFVGLSATVLHDLGKVDVKAISKELDQRVDRAVAEIENLEADYDRMVELGASDEELAAKKQEIRDAEKAKNEAAALATLTKIVSNVQDTYKQAFNEAENMLSTYKGHIDARLQGSDKSYNDIMDKISSNLSMSPFVKTQNVIATMREAVDQGIAYNVEQRSFLQSISDKIANTFDAFDSNLTRLIRLQQADTTAARLGMEAALTKFFNSTFSDTSYLQGLSDQVAAAIIDANASLDRNKSAEFEYIVQKWLGSLASVGMSESTITNIATGLNYVATGDVTSLASNTQLQTLFAMSAAKGGLEYSQLLLNGLDAESTNKLLESMVGYLKDIAENSDSQVVRSAYGDIFNMSLSDMKAISNLSAGDISNIASSTMTYGNMTSELNSQLLQVITRTSMSEMMSNLYNNAIFGVAEDMASNPATFAMTKMLDFMEANKLDMAIPFVNAMGFGLDLNTSVQDIMRLGVGLSQAFNLMTNILGGLGSAGGLNLNAWGGTEYNKRGNGMSFSTGSVFGGTSGSTYVATSSSQDMKNSSLSSATDDADESSKITNKNNKTEYTFDDFYKNTIGESAKSYIKVQDVLFAKVYNSDINYLGARDSRMLFTNGSLHTYDKPLVDTITEIFGNTSLLIDSKIKVYDGSLNSLLGDVKSGDKLKVKDDSLSTFSSSLSSTFSTIKVKPAGEALAVHIASAADSAKLASNTVNLAAGTSITIDEATLTKAFKKAMGHSEKDDVMNINDLIEKLSTGELVIRIANESGRRLQVDTEAMGTSGYASSINW